MDAWVVDIVEKRCFCQVLFVSRYALADLAFTRPFASASGCTPGPADKLAKENILLVAFLFHNLAIIMAINQQVLPQKRKEEEGYTLSNVKLGAVWSALA